MNVPAPRTRRDHLRPSEQVTTALRRSLFQVLAVLALIASVGFGLAQTTSESLGFVGPVAAAAEYQTYEPQDEEPRLQQEWNFDADGVLTTRVYYSYSFMDGSLNYRQETAYEAGQAQGSENVAPDGTVVGRTVEERDGEGRRIRSTFFDEAGVEARRTAWIYDGAGNLAVRETYRNGELVDRDEYEYDGQGRRIAARELDGDGNVTEETTYTVPDLEYETIEYEDDGTVEERSVVVNGEHGVISAHTYLPDGTLRSSTVFTYGENGLPLQREDYVTYESMGQVQESESTTVYQYEFDEVGNWIRRTSMEDGAAIELEVREIAYR